MTNVVASAVVVMVLVAAALAIGLWVGGQQFGGVAVRPQSTPEPALRSADDRAVVEAFFAGHDSFVATSASIRDAADHEDWGTVRFHADILTADAAATSLSCSRLTLSRPLRPFRNAYMDELKQVEKAGTAISTATAAADPVVAVGTALGYLTAAADGYDRVYSILTTVGDGGWSP